MTPLPYLDHLTVLRFSGDDAAAFLHGQLSCHVTDLAAPAATFGSYNTPKGRMLASFLLVRHAAGFDMIIDAGIATAVAKRLQMFVLRSKVRIANLAAEVVVLGSLEGESKKVLGGLGIVLNSAPQSAIEDAATGSWIRLDGGRVLAVIPRSALEHVAALAPVGWADSIAWQRADVQAGIPWITTATQDALVPQMANLDLIGGVHFQKGCYPGQEIVARTHHLGKVKRRMVVARIEAADPAPQPGDAVVGADVGDQASGLIVNAVPDAQGGYDVLAVMQISTIAARAAHLRSLAGPVIAIGAQPYSLQS